MKFVQTIEFQTSRIDEIMALDSQWREATSGKRTATAMNITRDRDRPNTYVWMIEFPSYEDAMRNNDLPETQQIAEQMMKLADGPAVFRNLDVVEQRQL
jgi:quinol monooxygenase YgiN